MRISIKFFIFIFILFISCSQKSNKEKFQVEQSNKQSDNSVKAPDFTLASLEGDWLTLSDLKGKVVLLNFWATWCGPCKMEIPDLNRLQEKYQDAGLVVLGITLSSGGPVQISKFSESWGINYKILTDINGNETEMVTNLYGSAIGSPISGVPTSFIIDRNGFIVKTYIGPRTENVFYNDLKNYF